ncbi:MAG: hypothetical protein Q8P67_08165, partial [archaeon]|nr:hypothetical protein [archaeon]
MDGLTVDVNQEPRPKIRIFPNSPNNGEENPLRYGSKEFHDMMFYVPLEETISDEDEGDIRWQTQVHLHDVRLIRGDICHSVVCHEWSCGLGEPRDYEDVELENPCC